MRARRTRYQVPHCLLHSEVIKYESLVIIRCNAEYKPCSRRCALLRRTLSASPRDNSTQFHSSRVSADHLLFPYYCCCCLNFFIVSFFRICVIIHFLFQESVFFSKSCKTPSWNLIVSFKEYVSIKYYYMRQ